MKAATITICRPDTGAVLPFANVTVMNADGVTKATIYTAAGGPQSNPTKASSTGTVTIAAPDATYILYPVSSDGTYSVPAITIDLIDIPAFSGTMNAKVAAAAASAVLAQQAATVTQGFCNALSIPATALPYEVTAITGGIGTGTGGTPGTYNLGATGGPAGFRGTVTIDAAGKIGSYAILNPGIASTNAAPTLSLAGVTGLTGATTPTATVAVVPANRVFLAPSSDTTQLLAWINNAGSLSRFPTTGTAFGYPTGDFVSTVVGYAIAAANLDTGAYYSRTTGLRTVNAGYQNLVYNVVAGERGYRATATLGTGSAASLAVFFSGASATGTVLGYQSLPDSLDHVNEVLTLPTGTVSIVINGTLAGLALRLDKLLVLDGITLTQQAKAGLRAQTRNELAALGTVSTDFGNQAMVFGYAASGDTKPIRYVRGGGVFPTSNGWGIDTTETNLPALAFGIASSKDDAVDTSGNALDIYRTPTLSRSAENVNDTQVTTPGSGLFTPKGIDWDKLHYIDLASAATLEIDLSHLPTGKTYSFSSLYESNTGRIVFDAGYGNTFLDTGTRYLSCSAGTKIEIQRRSYSQISIVTWSQFGGNAAPTGIAQGSYTPTVRTTSAFFAGQSLVQQGYGYGASHGAFCTRLAALTGPASVHMVNAAYGGSGICERDADASSPTNYWVNMTTPASPADGPNLTAAMAIIASKNGDSSQPAYGFAILDHGQQSSFFVDAPGAPNASFTKAMYKTATQYMITRLRSAAGNSTLKIGLRTIGRRSAWSSSVTGRMQVIRDAQLEMIAADANLFLAGETYDVELRDAVHPTDTGYDLIGYRDADEVAKVVYAKTGMVSHPTIISATLNTTFNYVDVVIRTGNYSGANVDRIFLVPDLRGFAAFNAAGSQLNVAKSFWTGVDTSNPSYQQCTLRLFLDGAASGGTLYYLWDSFPGFDPQRPVRTTQSSDGKSLRSAKIAL